MAAGQFFLKLIIRTRGLHRDGDVRKVSAQILDQGAEGLMKTLGVVERKNAKNQYLFAGRHTCINRGVALFLLGVTGEQEKRE